MRPLTVIATTALLAMSLPVVGQTCKTDSIEPSVEPDRMVDNADGTVTDAQTGLMWSQCSLGQTWTESGCEGAPNDYSWREALQAAKQFNDGGGLAGNTDWRLPNIKELSSIVEHQCDSPAINLTFFPDTPSATYLSSTPAVNQSAGVDGGRSIDFGTGSDLTPEVDALRHVRLVRDPGN